jgi:hypothetical protein
MASRDPAFLWETEALRTSSTMSSPGSSPVERRLGHWLPLRQASDATGVPLSTLRNWARKGRIPTALEEFSDGTRRIVPVEAVRERARQLGQPVSEEPPSQPTALESGQATPPPGTMLVPIAAWDKMLIQLGNLHEAGQQLAEARERAARAETEAAFLRERLAEMREIAPDQEAVSDTSQPQPAAVAEPEPGRRRMPRFSAYLWRLAVSERKRGTGAPSTQP